MFPFGAGASVGSGVAGGGVVELTRTLKHLRHEATYLSAPPITSRAVSSVMRRVNLFWKHSG
jgi:hypothetical protein